MSNGLLALLSGVFQGMGQARERKTQEEYKKALIDYNKSQAKHLEQKINLDFMKQQQEQQGMSALLAEINRANGGDMPPQQMPQAPMMQPPQTGGVMPQMPQPQVQPQSMNIPQGLAPIIQQVSRQENVPHNLISAIIQAESRFNPGAVSPKGAQGLMQLMPATAQGLGVQDPMDPAQNVAGGARYIKAMLQRYNGNLPMALAAYNWGPENVDKQGMQNMPAETKNYLASVLGNMQGAGQQQRQGFVFPASGRFTSGFNAPRGDRLHYGGDIATGAGEPVVAPANMRITQTRGQMSNSPGGMVWGIDQQGIEHRLHHIQPGAVKVGDVVQAGQPIGTVSNINGPHADYKQYDTRTGQFVDWTKGQAGGQPQEQPTAPQGKKGTPIDWNNPVMQILAHKYLGYAPKMPNQKIIMGDDGNFYIFEGDTLKKTIQGPGKMESIDITAPGGGKYRTTRPRPTVDNPNPLPVDVLPTDPGPMKSVIPMTTKDREQIDEWQESIVALQNLEQFANNPALFGPQMDIYADLLTGKGATSRAVQSYAGPQEELISFRNQLEKFNADLRSKRYGAALSEQEAANFYREALNARTPQEFKTVLKDIKKSLARKLSSKVKSLQGTQEDYLKNVGKGAEEHITEPTGPAQQPVIRYRRNPQTGKLERF